VFIDNDIPPGAEWPDHLRRNLGGSVSLVAVLTPAYFRLRHEWCGKEWAAMSMLGHIRLQDTSTTAIIPVCYRETTIPLAAGNPQRIDLTRLTTSSRDYHEEPEFKSAVLDICHQIIHIADEVRKSNCHVDLNGFSFPLRSPFIVLETGPNQPPPVRAA
jgi:hypothetical protein